MAAMGDSVMKMLKDLFALYDLDGGGTITIDEMVAMERVLCQAGGRKFDEQETKANFAKSDDDGNGDVECDEFLAYYNKELVEPCKKSGLGDDMICMMIEGVIEQLKEAIGEGGGGMAQPSLPAMSGAHSSSRKPAVPGMSGSQSSSRKSGKGLEEALINEDASLEELKSMMLAARERVEAAIEKIRQDEAHLARERLKLAADEQDVRDRQAAVSKLREDLEAARNTRSGFLCCFAPPARQPEITE